MSAPADPRLRGHAAALWVAAGLALGAGLYLDLAGVGPTRWLPRAGCLVVVLGIWSGLGGLVREAVWLRGHRLRGRLARARLRRRHRRRPEALESALRRLEQREHELEAARAARLRLSAGALEASLLVAGTLVWGFGDLLPVPA